MEFGGEDWVDRVDLGHSVRDIFPQVFLEGERFCGVENILLLKRADFLDLEKRKIVRPRGKGGGRVEEVEEVKWEGGGIEREGDSSFEGLRKILRADPVEIEFHNFEIGKIVKRIIMIKNVSDETIARYQLAKRFDASKLRFIWGTRSGDREDLAPGMSTALTFVFKSRSPEDYEERIVINVEGGFPVIIDVSAHRDPPILIGIPIREIRAYNKSSVSLLWSGDVTSSKNSSSDASTTPGDDLQQILSPWRGSPTSLSNEMELDCKNSLVGDEKLVETQLTNFGSSGRFFLISEANWHCRDITDLTDTCKLLTPSFSLWPAYFHLENNQSLILKTLFTPGHPGLHVEKIFIVCDNISVESFELLGDGVMFHWDFLHFSENLRRQSLPELEDNRFSNFFTAQLHPESLSVLVAVSNLSEFDLNFRWDVINDICLGVLPESGILPGNSTLTFDVFSRNYDLCSEFVESNLQLVLEDLPPQAIPREYQEFVEASRRKWRFPDAVEICVANVGVRLPSRTHSIISEEISSGNRDEENFYSDSIEN